MSAYRPPFQLTHPMLTRVAEIAELLGRWKQSGSEKLVPQLRRGNRIRTIQASLAIEQNSLTLEQVTAVLEGKPVLGPPRDIQEVRNAFAAYEAMPGWNPALLADLLEAHRLLLHGLADDAGRLRRGGVGIYQNERLVHMAPPARRLPQLMADLLEWLAATEAHPLIASSAFHYELEFIHPFSDGNGRIGRLWQTLILSRWHPELAYLPVETVIKSRQADYYRVLGECDSAADCTPFILFMLDAIADTLQQALAGMTERTDPVADPVTDPVDQLILTLGERSLAPSVIQAELGLKHRPTFRANYLHPALERGLVEMTLPEKPQSRLQQYRLTPAGQGRLQELINEGRRL